MNTNGISWPDDILVRIGASRLSDAWLTAATVPSISAALEHSREDSLLRRPVAELGTLVVLLADGPALSQQFERALNHAIRRRVRLIVYIESGCSHGFPLAECGMLTHARFGLEAVIVLAGHDQRLAALSAIQGLIGVHQPVDLWDSDFP